MNQNISRTYLNARHGNGLFQSLEWRRQRGFDRLFNPTADVVPGWGVLGATAPARMERDPSRACWREVGRLDVDPAGPIHALHRRRGLHQRSPRALPGIKANGDDVVVAQGPLAPTNPPPF